MKAYHDLLNHILERGVIRGDRTGTGTRSVFGYQMRMNLNDGFPLLTTKKLPMRWITEELLWFLSGSTDAKVLQDKGITIWDAWSTKEQCARFGRDEGDLGPVYGELWTAFGRWDLSRTERIGLREPSPRSDLRPDPYGLKSDGSFTIIGEPYRDDSGKKPAHMLCDVKFASGYVKTGVRLTHAEDGSLKDPYAPTVCGIGYLGNASENREMYKRWSSMLQRCYDVNHVRYSSYGGRGVRVCARWLSFEAFCEDAPKLPGYGPSRRGGKYHLDKDHYGDGTVYSPETCAWLPAEVNMAYTRWKAFEAVSPTGQKFYHGSATAFARTHGLKSGGVSKVLRQELSHHKGWSFRYVDIPNLRFMAPVNQIQRAVDMIRNNPESRRILVSGWDPHTCDRVALPPCHLTFQFYVDTERRELSCQLYQRSADVFLGVPFNIASYALLTHMVAQVTGYGVGDFVHTFGDVHIYMNHEEQVREQLSREPLPLPKLILDPHIKDIDDFRAEHVSLVDYKPYPGIKAPVAI